MTEFVVEVPTSIPLAVDPNRHGHFKQVLEEASRRPVRFTDETDIGWAAASERPPLPPTLFESKEEAEAKLRRTVHRAEILAAATNTGVSPFIRAGRVSPASVLEVAADFHAEVEVERRAAQLDLLRKAEARATALRESEERELAAIRAESSAELQRLKQNAGGTDWGALGGHPKIQSRRRRDGSEVFRARLGGEVSPTFSSVDEAVGWRDARSEENVPPLTSSVPVAAAEGSRLV